MKVDLNLPSYVSSKRLDAYFRGGGAPFVGAEDGSGRSSGQGEGVRSIPTAEVDLRGADRPDQSPPIVDLTERPDDVPEQENLVEQEQAIADPAEGRQIEVAGDGPALTRKRRRVSDREDEIVPEALVAAEPVVPEDAQLGGQTNAPSEGEDPPITAAAGLLRMGEEASAVDERGVLRWFRRARMEAGESTRGGLPPEIEGLIRDLALSSAKTAAYSNQLIDGMAAEIAKARQVWENARQGLEASREAQRKLDQALEELATERRRSDVLNDQIAKKISECERVSVDHAALLEAFDASQDRIAHLERLNSELEGELREVESRFAVAEDLGAVRERERLLAIWRPRFEKLAAHIRGRDAVHSDLMLMSQAKGIHEAYLGLAKEMSIPRGLVNQVATDFVTYRDRVAAADVPEVGPADLLFAVEGEGIGCSNAPDLPPP